MARVFTKSGTKYLEYAGAVVSSPPFTFACWFYADAGLALNHLMTLSRVSGGTGNHGMRTNTDGTIYVYSNDGTVPAGIANTSTTYSATTWHHACGVWAAANNRAAFLDGGGKGTNTTSRTPTVGLTEIAATLVSGSYTTCDGRICHAAIWNVALSDDEVASLAKKVHPTRIQPASLVAYWPLGGFNGEYDLDIWGGYNMTAYNSPTWTDDPPGIQYPSRIRIGVPAAAVPPAAGPNLLSLLGVG